MAVPSPAKTPPNQGLERDVESPTELMLETMSRELNSRARNYRLTTPTTLWQDRPHDDRHAICAVPTEDTSHERARDHRSGRPAVPGDGEARLGGAQLRPGRRPGVRALERPG